MKPGFLKYNSLLFAALTTLLLLSSCATPKLVKPIQPVSVEMQELAKEFKAAISGSKETGVVLTGSSIDFYEEIPEELALRLSMLGIGRTYLKIEPETLDDDQTADNLHGIIAALSRKNIQSNFIISDYLFYASGITHDSLQEYPDGKAVIHETAKRIMRFNRQADEDGEKISGVTLIVNPHRIRPDGADTPRGLLYAWNDKSYGKSMDNDMLMRQSFDIIQQLTTELESLPLSVEIANFYHDQTVAGKLSIGQVNDFLKHSQYLIITAFDKSSKQIVARAAEELKKCQSPNSIVVGVRTDSRLFGDYTEAQSLSRKKWKAFAKSVKTVVSRCSKDSAFRGICFYSFDGLEQVWERE
ncbi:MAG: hypothetical protein WC071_04270 [Victivallaceae bacterium]